MIALVLAVVGAGVVVYATHHGVGYTPDSRIYLETADRLASGRGLTHHDVNGSLVALTHYPPGYPVALAGAKMTVGVRALQAALFAVNAGLMFLVIRRWGGGRSLAALGAAVWLTSPTLITLHAVVLSEGLFLTCMLAWLMVWPRCAATGTWSWHTIRGIALAAALASLVRYPGAALILAAAAAIGWLAPGRGSAAKPALAYAFRAFVPLGFWFGMNLILRGSMARRELGWHPPTTDHALQLFATPGEWLGLTWLGPDAGAIAAWVAIIVLLVAVSMWHRKARAAGRVNADPSNPWPLAWALLLVYPAMLLVSITLFDAETPLDDRLLGPVFVIVILLGTAGVEAGIRRWGGRATAATIAGSVLLLAILGNLLTTGNLLTSNHNRGIAYNTTFWQNSPLLAELDDMTGVRAIYSNAPDLIYLHTGLIARQYPPRWSPNTRRANDAYDAELAAMAQHLVGGQAILVHFDRVAFRDYLPPVEEIRTRVSLQPVATDPGGTIYAHR